MAALILSPLTTRVVIHAYISYNIAFTLIVINNNKNISVKRFSFGIQKQCDKCYLYHSSEPASLMFDIWWTGQYACFCQTFIKLIRFSEGSLLKPSIPNVIIYTCRHNYCYNLV